VIWLVRHGETTWNREGRYQGRRESDLTELGRAQSAAVAKHFVALRERGGPSPARIVASPLRRAVETAKPVAGALGLDVELDDRLVEVAHGDWEGRLKADVERDDPDRVRTWRTHPNEIRFPGGESLADVAVRWRAVAPELVADGRPTLVVTHDVVVRVALLEAMSNELEDYWRLRVENGAISTLESMAGRLGVVEPNAVEHLAGLHADAREQAL